jgi:hypothetical protein
MKRTVALMGLIGVIGAVSGCGPNVTGNPPQLWLALNGSEVNVRLVPVEPNPF